MKILFIFLAITAIKILATYVTLRINRMPKSETYAEDLILGRTPEKKNNKPIANQRIHSDLYCYMKTPSKAELIKERTLNEQRKEQYRIALEEAIKREEAFHKTIQIPLRDPEIEGLYNKVRLQFKTLMKNGELNRDYILAIREFLEYNVKVYEHKKFKNDAHAIYVMLSAKDIKADHLLEINRVLTQLKEL